MSRFNRRTFLETSAGLVATGSGASALSQQTTPSATAATELAAAIPPPPPTTLGSTGITTSRLAFGTGMHGYNRQSNQTRQGFEKFVKLFQHAYDRGLRMFDLADLYGTHLYFREALRTIQRAEVAILT